MYLVDHPLSDIAMETVKDSIGPNIKRAVQLRNRSAMLSFVVDACICLILYIVVVVVDVLCPVPAFCLSTFPFDKMILSPML